MSFVSLIRTIATLLGGRTPGQLVIQFTDHCNARCPQCGMRTTNTFPRKRLELDDVRRVLDAAVEKGVRVVSFTGGEPLLHMDDLTALMRHAGEAEIEYIRTGTNGYLFARPDGPRFLSRIHRVAESFSETPLRNFWISNRNLGGEPTRDARIGTGSSEEIERFHRGMESEAYPCRRGLDAFFVDSSDGNTYPCGYRGGENLGRFWELDVGRTRGNEDCRLCDWECFRDPSELFGPLLQARRAPPALLRRLRRDQGYAALWLEDLGYYLACDLFDGRRPPNYRKLERFSKASQCKPNDSGARDPLLRAYGKERTGGGTTS